MTEISRALLSVSDKEGIVELGRGLTALGISLLSTGGTAEVLRSAGLEVQEVSQITGFPEMISGRVKTLHPRIHAGILAVREEEDHMQQLADAAIETIDLVVCNLYPFAQTVAREGVTLEEALENIDIGGPSMIRSAAKNFKDVVVVVDPADYNSVLATLNQKKGEISFAQRQSLAWKAFRHTADYDRLIEKYLAGLLELESSFTDPFPEKIGLNFIKKAELRYGENPHQQAAFYIEKNLSAPSLAGARQLCGRDLSFNNINDGDAALELVKEFIRPACAVIKHTNPCGAAVGENLLTAYQNAYAGDPLSAYGSIVALNGEVDANLARAIGGEGKFVELVIAPAFSSEAVSILQERWKNVRLLEVGPLDREREELDFDLKRIKGGLLVQERDLLQIKEKDLEFVTEKKPTAEQLKDLLFSWKVVKHVKSNAIVMAREQMVVGVGAGQMSRVDAMLLAGIKSAERARGGVAASDAFFPFPDAIEEAARLGIKAIIQPGGSIRDKEVIAACDQAGLAMVFTGKRHFRH